MRVIIGCESSGIIREEFIIRGHDAWSCDLLPSEVEGPHIQDDILNHLDDGWDLGIFHPPCTYLSYAANKYWNEDGRKEKRDRALEFFLKLYSAPIPKVCVENPKGYPNTVFRKPDQVIHPYYFGDRHMKMTCLWIRGLPKLFYSKEDSFFWKKTFTDLPPVPIYIDRKSGKKRYFIDAISGKSKNCQTIRSRTFLGIAKAMAEQWG
ncbi:MAG: hypothetical protein UU28_C0026G0002 [Parcubacteria group bacterium GW2011_GWD2_40_9]|nr:MAG: hypothetical protein UU28_C0026G0002 [Parcubacteria group bacterium GW2011_GWD2_40_9]